MSSALPRPHRALTRLAVATSALVLLVSGGAYGYVSYLDSKIQRIGSLCVRSDCPKSSGGGGATNFLLVGVDSRAGDNGAGVNAGLKGKGTDGVRSDTVLLVHISGKRDQVSVVSFPRDLYVTSPAYVNPEGGNVAGAKLKFNAAFSHGAQKSQLYAAQLLTQQISDNFNVPVDHYVQIDFSGFQKMVDALHGVEICLSKRADDFGDSTTGGSGFHMSAGKHNISGTTALQFVRQRHGLGSDLDRINRQQRFLASMLRKVESAGTLTNPLKLNSFLNAAVSSIKLDNSTSRGDLQKLATNMRGLGTDKIKFFTVPTDGSVKGSDGDDLKLDEAKTKALMDAIREDRDPTVATAVKPVKTTPVTPADPATVTVASVQNASGVTGAAGEVATTLRTANVTVPKTETVAKTTGGTSVRYGSAAAAQAAAVAKLLPGSHVTADSTLDPNSVIVTIGATASTASSSTSPTVGTPSPSASATKAPVTATFDAKNAYCGP